MKAAAEKFSQSRLLLMQNRTSQPARTDDTVRLADVPGQIQQRTRRCRAVRVRVTDEIAERGELETLDERAALADRLLEFQRADGGKIHRDLLDDAERVIRAAVEDDDDLEFAGIMRAEKRRVIAQHRFDARFFVVSRDQDEQAWVRHADSVTENFRAGNLGKKRAKEICKLIQALSIMFCLIGCLCLHDKIQKEKSEQQIPRCIAGNNVKNKHMPNC